jgi:anti-sigma factor RsiW
VTCEIVERDLEAYVDRELDPAAAAGVREHIAGCAACRRRVAEREALGRLVRSMPSYAVPDRLRASLAGKSARSQPLARLVPWAAAAMLALSVGGGITFVRFSSTRDHAMVEEAVNGHVRSLMAEHLFDVRSTDQHTVKPWFLGKLDFAPPVVDLASIGFPLVGGRLDYLRGQPAAALVYQRQQHTINVFISPVSPRSDESGAIEGRTDRGFHVHHWIRGDMSFWVVSDLNNSELTQFVRALQAS